MYLVALTCIITGIVPARNGIERFEMYRGLVEGRAAGIVAHHASVAGTGDAVEFLTRRGVRLLRVFSPEHGFQGKADAGEHVDDARAGVLPVISLYGKKVSPSREDLKGIEVMIFDLQDVGTRFYTYLSTLHHVMAACAREGIPLIVMDRSNPHAASVEGPVLREEFRSFVGMHPVPILYGMTIGEYARMINGEGWLGKGTRCDLTVIPCEHWRRGDPVVFPRAPSPNLPDSTSVMLYPSLCLFEGTVVNEGRGTMTPFQVFGHPDLVDMPYCYTPRAIAGMSLSPKCEGVPCRGMDLRDQYLTVRDGQRVNLSWLLRAYRSYRGASPFFLPLFDLLAGSDALRRDIIAGKNEEEIRASWGPELEQFLVVRQRYLIEDYDGMPRGDFHQERVFSPRPPAPGPLLPGCHSIKRD
ncbi:MAG: DUF1343 domain-containing protein [Odoribacteraceae bacterium]|jgi:uncharacterized protein YbbC (DUF1343 family)|nr:DUF1343 domain-containing protein [Odoribacteraceae bacterium]